MQIRSGFIICFIFLVSIAEFNSPVQGQSNEHLKEKLSGLELFNPERIRYTGDWLVRKPSVRAGLFTTKDHCLLLSNGLISRKLAIYPDGATVGYDNLVTNVSVFRAVKPEASITINGQKIYVGGLNGQPVMNYFNDSWLTELKENDYSMHLRDFELSSIIAPFNWKKRLEWMPEDRAWPPEGIELVMFYQFDTSQKSALIDKYGIEKMEYLLNLEVEVHYEMYTGLPLLAKWIVVNNKSTNPVRIDSFESELLAYVEPESVVGDKSDWMLPLISVETDYAFGGSMSGEASMHNSYKWMADSTYKTIINYSRKQPALLVVTPLIGPGITVDPGGSFQSYKVFELIHDTSDKERQGLAMRKMYRNIAPWVTENPILMHVRQADDESVRKAIDQCADVGFEMVIMTFGSGFNIEDSSDANLERLRVLAEYAHRKGIALGGYSLLASRSINKENDVVMPDGKKPRFNNSPCLQSSWGRQYFRNLYNFYSFTGLDILEHDGSYPGDICISTDHPGHRNGNDSQWNQFKIITDFYKWCREKGIYLNVPDWYFLNASNKTGMGYRETNWSLPRKHQEIIERQNIYDGTWEKTPSMGWMFVPLVQYHGGGEAATIEPLKEHLEHYEQRLANLFGAGVQACYRGPRLYDAPETRILVKNWVDFYLKHRKILNADIIHVRRPDGRDYDGILHADPEGEEKGFLMLYNPTDKNISRRLQVDLYYTGVRNQVMVSREDGEYMPILVDPRGRVTMDVNIPAHKWTWYVFK